MVINPDTLEIEIVNVEAIDGGVQVFARAWSDKVQIGFGTDGTVDIERFRLFNPPILVCDDAGSIVRIQEADDNIGIPYAEMRYREDPKQALLESLAHILTVKKEIFGTAAIVPGKVGNTTSTFYPDSGTGGTTIDGQLNHSQGGATGVSWATLRNGAGTAATATATTTVVSYLRARATSGNYDLMIRSAFGFDTSAIPDTDAISSATLSFYGTAAGSTQDLTANVVSKTLASNSNLSSSDYAIANYGSTKFSTGKLFSTWNTSGFNDFVLNASGIAHINKTGVTNFGTLSEEEIDNTAPTPTGGGSVITSSITCYTADQSGTSQDPTLVVEHASAGGAAARNAIFAFGGI